ncbi:MAG: hypothetical protein J5J00_01355 [Deltaproteobacteria bacterium]|nr:hypothetical protein [Deltaproteobacteria bacterium]
MQIITMDDSDFPALLTAWRGGKCVGRYWEHGKVRTVCASPQYLIVSSGNGTSKFAYKPTRSLDEAWSLARQLLSRQESRGNKVEFSAESSPE